MAYRDDITALGANHLYPCDANLNDIIGTLNFTNSGGVFTGPAICEDISASYVTSTTSDTATAVSDPTIQDITVDYCYCLWFRTTAIQQPPCRVFGDGDQTVNNTFFLGFGNSIVCEVDCDPTVIQVGSDTAIAVNRSYHIALVFRDIGGGSSELEFFLDGVSQGTATVADVNSIGRVGMRIGGVTNVSSYSIGGSAFQLVSPVDGQYAMIATFTNTDVPTNAEIRNELFEKGAIPGTTIPSGSQSAMQAALDALASSVRPNEPLNIRVEAVVGDGDVTLTADNITHDPLASAHVQYMGTGTLSWINDNGSNASIGSTPNGGSITFIEDVPVTVTVISATDQSPIEGARVRLTDTSGEIVNTLTDVNGQVTFNYAFSDDEAISGRVRKGSSSPYYVTSELSGTITSSGFSTTVLMILDE